MTEGGRDGGRERKMGSEGWRRERERWGVRDEEGERERERSRRHRELL